TLDLGRHPRHAEAIRVVVVGAREHVVVERHGHRLAGLGSVSDGAHREQRDRCQLDTKFHVITLPAMPPDHGPECHASAGSADVGLGSGALSRATPNQAAYKAGTKKIVRSVAMVSPPMIAIA